MTGALDTRTKSTSACRVDESTGEVSADFDLTLKWQLQAAARLALGVFDPNVEYEQGHRLRVCCRHVRYDTETRKSDQVRVMESAKSGGVYFAGVMACGSVWVCPICAPKIQAVRALEVRQAIDQWTAQGGSVVLLTQTVPHSRQDVLEVLLERFTKALEKFKGQRGYERARKCFGIEGSIKALEVTHGANGWHPHAHTILFLQDAPPISHVRLLLFPLWESAARRAGFEKELSPAAFDVQDASEVKKYLTKMGTEYQWNAEHELVKAHSKRGSSQSMTPFDMLRRYVESPDSGRLLALFGEYSACFEGKRQLVWSNGLKKRLLGTDGLSDEQIAESIGEADVVLAHIPLDEWGLIRRHNLQGEVFRVVQEFGAPGLRNLLGVYRVGGDKYKSRPARDLFPWESVKRVLPLGSA